MTTKQAPDAFTAALAEVLSELVRDQHRKFPTLGDFKLAMRASVAKLSADTVERIMNGRSSIRVDYLYAMAALLEVPASEIVAQAESRVASGETGVRIEVADGWDGTDRRKDPSTRAWFEENSGTGESDRQGGQGEG